ncbi:MAG: recombinase family protein [Verrucomicrobia bacterium]|nr:recombinase family protein [Verrucomicrobiota bacterium]
MIENIKTGRIYGRFSSQPQEKGDSKRRQIEGAKAYATKKGIEIVGEYFDEAVSGKSGANLELEFGRLLQDSKEGEIIICEQVDRIGRQNPFILGKLIWDTVSRGVEIHIFQSGQIISKENINNLDTQFSLFTGSAVGHADNRRRIDRINAKFQDTFAKARQGIQTGALVCFLPQCFRWDDTKNKIIILEDKAEVIRNIFRLYIEGHGASTICKMLNENKTPTLYTDSLSKKLGKPRVWCQPTIRHIIRTEAYAGTVTVKGEKYTCIPKVISREDFDIVQLLIKRNTRRAGKISGRPNNLFSTIGTCKHCGGAVKVHASINKKRRLLGKSPAYTYSCKNKHLGACTAKCKMIKSQVVELSFFNAYFGGNPENLIKEESIETLEKIQAKENRIETLNKSIVNLYDLVEEGDDTAKNRIKERKQEKQTLESEITILRGDMSLVKSIKNKLSIIWELLGIDDPNISEPNIKETLGIDDKDYIGTNIKEVMNIIDKDILGTNMRTNKSNKSNLEAKLSDWNLRKKIQNILPSLFSKLVFDFNNQTLQAIDKDGTPLETFQMEFPK